MDLIYGFLMENRLLPIPDNNVSSCTFQGDEHSVTEKFQSTRWTEKRSLTRQVESVLSNNLLPDLNSEGDNTQEYYQSGLFLNLSHTTTWKDRLSLKEQVSQSFDSGDGDGLDGLGLVDRQILRKQSKAMSLCSRALHFEQDSDSFRFVSAEFCRVRSCPVCQWRRSMRWVARFHERLPLLMRDFSSHRFLLLTLTVRNVSVNDLKSTFSCMQSAWARLRKLKQFSLIADLGGYLKSFEVTRSASDQAHPHFHILLHVPASYFVGSSYLTQSDWTDMWRRSLRVNYQPVVDIRVVGGRRTYQLPGETAYQKIFRGVLETVKYETKVGELIYFPDFFRKMVLQLRGKRSIELGGTLRDYLSDELPDFILPLQEELPRPVSGDDWQLSEEEISSIVADRDFNFKQYTFIWDRKRGRYFLCCPIDNQDSSFFCSFPSLLLPLPFTEKCDLAIWDGMQWVDY